MKSFIEGKTIQVYLERPLKEIWDIFLFQMKKCPVCLSDRMRLLRYNEHQPRHTKDTWHEFQCLDCQNRIGRWSGYFLRGHNTERKGYIPITAQNKYATRYPRRVVGFDPTVGELPK